MRHLRPLLGRLALGLAAGLALCACGADLCAGDPKKDPDPLAKRRDSANRKWADEHADLGAFCHGKKLYREAAAEYEKALARWADQPSARARLGFKKDEAGAWVADPKAQVKRTNEVTGEAEAKAIKEYQDRLAKVEKHAGDDYWQVGKAFADAGRKEEAESLWRLAMGYDPDHAKVREALGYSKEDGKWVSPEEKAARDQVVQKIKQAGDGEEIPGESDEEHALGMKLSKRKSEHFRILAYFDQEKTKELVRLAETTFAEFHALFEQERPVLSHIEGVVLQTEAQHCLYVDKVSTEDPREKEATKKLAGEIGFDPDHFEGYEGEHGHDYPKDFTVHDTTHLLFTAYLGVGGDKLKGWLYEGMAYWFSARITNTALEYCIGQESGAMGGGREFEDPRTWRGTVKEEVKKGGGPDMRAALSASINSLTPSTVLKGWSVIDFFLAKHKKEFFAFLDGLRHNHDQEAALKDATGWGYADLEREWKKYVLENY